MKASVLPNEFDAHVLEYESWFEAHPNEYLAEIQALKMHFNRLPEAIRGIEVGLGTGRFSQPLGILEGVEPATRMAEKARSRGIEVMQARAEKLPYADLQFDFVLFVTVCHLDSAELAFREAKRVLKHGGLLIIGFLPEDRPFAQEYRGRKKWSVFYKNAKFYTVSRIFKMVQDLGFKSPEWSQTLFGPVNNLEVDQFAKTGSDSGSFVVLSVLKP